uniref:Major facilitator superfamily (MFS) profile domain-containing protein n=2 Tax=Clytia hemisphaerica TaxID=252671 RepID=A0A7M5XIE5_9CNID
MLEEDASNSESSGQHSLSKVEESIGEFSPLLASKPQDSVGQSAIQDEIKPPKMFKSKREVVILIALSLMVFAATCCESILAPFFSPEAKSKGAGGTTIGAIFAIYPFSIFLLSPFVGKYLPIIGCRFCLLAGAFIMGGAQLLFGFVSTIESGSLFIVYCFAIRTVTAIGASMTSTAGLSILTISFKE